METLLTAIIGMCIGMSIGTLLYENKLIKTNNTTQTFREKVKAAVEAQGWTAYSDLYIKYSGRVEHVDLLIVLPSGLVVLKIVDVKGEVRYGDLYPEDGRMVYMNCGYQVLKEKEAVRANLPTAPVYGIVCYSKKATLRTKETNAVRGVDDLIKTLKGIAPNLIGYEFHDRHHNAILQWSRNAQDFNISREYGRQQIFSKKYGIPQEP